MIRVNPGVRLGGIRPEVVLALQVAEGVWAKYGSDEIVVTSATEGLHSTGSMHYLFSAVDIRVKNLASLSVVSAATAELRDRLGSDYRVINEAAGTTNAHCHIEFRPSVQYTAPKLTGPAPRKMRKPMVGQ